MLYWNILFNFNIYISVVLNKYTINDMKLINKYKLITLTDIRDIDIFFMFLLVLLKSIIPAKNKLISSKFIKKKINDESFILYKIKLLKNKWINSKFKLVIKKITNKIDNINIILVWLKLVIKNNDIIWIITIFLKKELII